jgi:hypothetical protein
MKKERKKPIQARTLANFNSFCCCFLLVFCWFFVVVFCWFFVGFLLVFCWFFVGFLLVFCWFLFFVFLGFFCEKKGDVVRATHQSSKISGWFPCCGMGERTRR